MLDLLKELKSSTDSRPSAIISLNYHFACLIDEKQQPYSYDKRQQNLAVLLAALVSYYVQQGHTCIRLDSEIDFFGLNKHDESYAQILQKIGEIAPLEWASVLRDHVAFAHQPMQIAPLLFWQNCLYFRRYWQAEQYIADYLLQAVKNAENFVENTAMQRTLLAQLFKPSAEIDWQAVAVATAMRKSFCVISGGPGTGKTYTVAKLLAALQLQQAQLGLLPLNVALAAPTGKAASRLKESILKNLKQLLEEISATGEECRILNENVPVVASTVHSLIGIRPFQESAKYHSENPLPFDLLVVDEASMIDLFLMEKLLTALKPNCRLILLGDKDQLASVESGAMMSELGSFIGKQEKAGHFSPAHCSYIQQITGYDLPYGEQHSAVSDSLCHLWKSRRFDGQSAIGQLAKLINEKKESWSIFEQHPNALHQITYPNKAQYADEYRWRQACVASIVKQAVACYRAYLEKVNDYVQWLQRNLQAVSKAEISAKIAEIFQCFNQVRFLSALREGDFGVEWLNIKIDETLKQQGIVSWQKNYFGKPVLITENAAQNHIYNGDIGLILPHLDGNGAIKARVYFEGEKEGERIHLSPNLLPANELAYVMTVHKSQGSEFAHTFLILPLADSPVLSKELIYTAVTRSLNEFTLFGEKGIWQKAVNRDLKRDSGLRSLLQRNNI